MTDEIALEAHPNDPTRFLWRVSVAAVASDGPFSSFPGVDRILMLVEGAGMDLHMGAETPRRVDRPFEPIAFAGETPVDCRLIDGPVRDFNVMTERALATATLEVAVGTSDRGAIELRREHIVVVLRGAVTAVAEAQAFRLETLDALMLSGPTGATLTPEPGCVVAIVSFRRHA